MELFLDEGLLFQLTRSVLPGLLDLHSVVLLGALAVDVVELRKGAMSDQILHDVLGSGTATRPVRRREK